MVFVELFAFIRVIRGPEIFTQQRGWTARHDASASIRSTQATRGRRSAASLPLVLTARSISSPQIAARKSNRMMNNLSGNYSMFILAETLSNFGPECC
jgi:hypothetical protein